MIKNLGQMFALFELNTPKQQGAGGVDNFFQNALQAAHDLIFYKIIYLGNVFGILNE